MAAYKNDGTYSMVPISIINSANKFVPTNRFLALMPDKFANLQICQASRQGTDLSGIKGRNRFVGTTQSVQHVMLIVTGS